MAITWRARPLRNADYLDFSIYAATAVNSHFTRDFHALLLAAGDIYHMRARFSGLHYAQALEFLRRYGRPGSKCSSQNSVPARYFLLATTACPARHTLMPDGDGNS